MARRNSSLISSKVQLEPGTVDATALTNDSIDAAKIQTNAVGSDEIAANAVGSSELANDAVDTDAIQDNAVSLAKLGADVELGASTGKAIAMSIVFG